MTHKHATTIENQLARRRKAEMVRESYELLVNIRYAAIMLRRATESGDYEAEQRWGLTILTLVEEYYR